MKDVGLVMDFYELTMAQVYFENNRNEEVTFDLFYRRNPDKAGYAIFAGLEEVIEYINDLSFSDDDINYLKSLNKFSDDFLTYLRNFKFSGNIDSVEEGSVVFPNEPLVRVRANLIEAQIIETFLLLAINHQSMIATKANRMVIASDNAQVVELGARRAHNISSANYGARAAYIGGVDASATVSAGKMFGLPIIGTMAHSFIQSFDDEYTAFLTYAKTYPDNCVLLLDTYDTLNQGLVNAIKVAKEYLIPNGYRLKGVRIDSGDIAYLSKKIRTELDANDLDDCQIIASNSFDEYLIDSLVDQNAKIDVFGVGENLICSRSNPVFGGVYKLSSVYKDGKYQPRIKISDNSAKISNPGYKEVYRIYNLEGKACGDVLSLYDECLDSNEDLTIYHHMDAWKHKTFKAKTYRLEKRLKPIFRNGKQVYETPSLESIRDHRLNELNSMWDEILRFDYPQEYYVDLTKKLLDLKLSLIEEGRNEK